MKEFRAKVIKEIRAIKVMKIVESYKSIQVI